MLMFFDLVFYHQSKKRGLSHEEKRQRMLEIFYEKVSVVDKNISFIEITFYMVTSGNMKTCRDLLCKKERHLAISQTHKRIDLVLFQCSYYEL